MKRIDQEGELRSDVTGEFRMMGAEYLTLLKGNICNNSKENEKYIAAKCIFCIFH